MAAVSVDNKGHPGRVKLTSVLGFTSEAIEMWSKSYMQVGCTVHSDGLACFSGVSAVRIFRLSWADANPSNCPSSVGSIRCWAISRPV